MSERSVRRCSVADPDPRRRMLLRSLLGVSVTATLGGALLGGGKIAIVGSMYHLQGGRVEFFG